MQTDQLSSQVSVLGRDHDSVQHFNAVNSKKSKTQITRRILHSTFTA